MTGGQRRMGAELVRRLRFAAHLLALVSALVPRLNAETTARAATPPPTAPAPHVVIAKPSAYHTVAPSPPPPKPLPRLVAPTPRRMNQQRVAGQPVVRQGVAQEGVARQLVTPEEAPIPQASWQRGPVQDRADNEYRPVPEDRPRADNRAPAFELRVRINEAPALPHPAFLPAPYAPFDLAQPPYARRVAYQGYPQNGSQRRENAPNPSAEQHLPAWIRKHQNQSPEERERSLRQEPGFNHLAPEQQQNLANTLHRLNEMPTDKRERTLMRMENMERLSPQMRDAVRSSARQLSDLPPDRKRLWQKAFRDLRDMPPEQRQEVLRSPEFGGQFSAQERSIMGNLLAVEPYRNPGPAQAPPLYGR